ncbi:PREDICTED: heavy metal-associated isoprenylated plant protein 3-like isoform X3 [Tarenaya hassleriana]|uniref:heavy metal-associated isoprenylated plant protein 3-like isoform X3 n=1 Tax=Tarenaya hassleriana TaxID=28532 RepID=UPI00053C5C39|nr:PREDICTED: heavy metal-associated isoprenylated plant protein 3-like isoform X3 [Tarenaya hassleriana]
MGEKKEEAATKPEGEKKPAEVSPDKKEGGGGGGGGGAAVVLKLELHCEGCGKKIKRIFKHYKGVDDVKIDYGANRLTVIGDVDPAKIRDRVAEKTKRKVELVSPAPKKDGGGGEKKPADENSGEKKEGKKEEDEKKPPAPPKEATVVFKTRLHCEGCIHKIRRIILKIKGVESVSIDGDKELVTVKGTMDVKELTPYLNEKLKRTVEIVPPPKNADTNANENAEKKGKDSAGEKKPKEEGSGEKKESPGNSAGGGVDDKKDKESSGGGAGDKKDKESSGGGAAVEVKKMEYHGYAYPTQPMYWYPPGGHVYGQNYAPQVYVHEPYNANQGYVQGPYNTNQGYVGGGYVMDPYAHLRAPQMFSDENPNGCSIV